jgi:hypothetical protein
MGISVPLNVASPVAVDPWSAGIMALGSVATKAVTPGSAQQTASYSSVFDTSGWSVNLGSGSASTTANKQTLPAVAATVGAAGSMLQNPMVLLLLGVAVVLAMRD